MNVANQVICLWMGRRCSESLSTQTDWIWIRMRIRKSNQQETKHPWTGIPLINTCSHNWTLFHDEGTSAWWKYSKYGTWMTVKNDRHSKRGIVFFFLFSCKSLTMISLLLHAIAFLEQSLTHVHSRSLFPLSFLSLDWICQESLSLLLDISSSLSRTLPNKLYSKSSLTSLT